MFNKFIKATDTYTNKKETVPAPYIRKSFSLDFKPQKAEIKICSSGFYLLFVNGKEITKGHLAPYIGNPDDILCYDIYDIAELLKEGKNSIGVILGNGFANQEVDGWGFANADFRAPLCVALILNASDGEKEIFLESDETFKTHPSPIIYDMYRYGTHYDARLETENWADADFDDSNWKNVLLATPPKGEITLCSAQPIKTAMELAPEKIEFQKDFCYLRKGGFNGEDIEYTHIDSGYLYDFGLNTSGVCRLKINGKKGQKITLRHGERLSDDGKFNLNSIYTFKENYKEHIHLLQTDIYILKGGEEEIFVPPFTYHGFRYVFVEGIEEYQATESLLTYLVFYSDIEKRSDFSCSDDVLNTLYKMGINSDKSNFHYFPTDCPHREKNGWTGDASVSAEQFVLSFDCSDSFAFWLKAIRKTQKDGVLPGIIPTTGFGYKWGNGPLYDGVCVNIPYYVYKYDGREDILSDNAKMIYDYLRYISTRRDENGLIAIGLEDWCQPYCYDKEIGVLAPLELTDSVLVYDISNKSRFIFEKLGLEKEKEFAEKLAEEMYKSIRGNLIDFETMTAKGNCQTSQALLLYFNIFSEEEKSFAYKRLIEIIERDKKHLICGVAGIRYLFDVLIKGGDCDLALYMIAREDEPSYGSFVKRGCTALCEILRQDHVHQSENHHFLGDIIRIFINYIAGLQIINPVEFLFSPVIPNSLNEANANYGDIKTGWKRDNDVIVAYCTVPKGVNGKFVYKDTEVSLKEGYNEFTI